MRRLVAPVVSAGLLVLLASGLASCTGRGHRPDRLLTRGAAVEAADAGDTPTTLPATDGSPPPTEAVDASDPTPVVVAPRGTTASRRSSVAAPARASRSAPPAPPAPRSTGFSGKAAPGEKPNVWAVVVGIQNYQGSTHHTYGGLGDTVVFQKLLARQGWPDSHVLVLADGQATIANIRSAMQWLVAHSSPDTFTLFHYSGHVCIASTGSCAGGHTHLWSVDNRFISEDEFSQNMRGLQGQAWVDVSGCEAAAFDRGISSPLRLFTGSSGATEKSYENQSWQESVWTGLLVDQGLLQGRADSNGDHRVSVQEAVGWAKPQASQMTEGQAHGPQHPVSYGGGDGAGWYLNAPQPTDRQPPPPPPPGGGNQPPSSPPTTSGCGSITKGLVPC
jgi:caspase domain-containing protein